MYDSHIHLMSEEYKKDLKQIVDFCPKNGVNGLINICLTKDELIKSTKLFKKYSWIKNTYGLHPADIKTHISNENTLIEELEKCAQTESIVAIGEIGLDFHWIKNLEMRTKQERIFIKQMEIAKKYSLPVVIHSRNAIDETYEILKNYPTVKGIIHAFSGNIDQANKFIEIGYLIGVGGAITFKNNLIGQEVVEKLKLSHIVLETDGPWLTPEPYRGERNQPSLIPIICAKIAEIKNEKIETVREETTKNCKEIFRIHG